MEMIPLFIYLAGIVDQINITMTIISALLLAAVVIIAIILMDQEGSTKADPHIIKERWKFWRKLIVALIICGTIGLLAPRDKTMYAIAGTYGAVKIIQAPESKELFEKSLKALNQKLDEYTEPNKPKENK